VPHCRFQRWRTISVRVFGVVHVKDSVETHRPTVAQLLWWYWRRSGYEHTQHEKRGIGARRPLYARLRS
jgi:hypothetical protein